MKNICLIAHIYAFLLCAGFCINMSLFLLGKYQRVKSMDHKMYIILV